MVKGRADVQSDPPEEYVVKIPPEDDLQPKAEPCSEPRDRGAAP